MDAVVAFIANGEATKPVEPGSVRSTTQRNTPRPLPWDVRRRPKTATMPRAARRSRCGCESQPRSPCRTSGRPRRPRTAGKSATKASRWVMSLTFAAVTCATSGTPRASVTMWCLDPALRRSVGFGPVFSRASRGPTRCPPPSSAGRAVPVGAARRGGSHASDARRRPVPTPPSVASTCCLSRIFTR